MVKKQPENDAIIFSMGAQMGADSQMGTDSQMGKSLQAKIIKKVPKIPPKKIAPTPIWVGFNEAMLPLFTANLNVREGQQARYYFSNREGAYMDVIPTVTNKIPGEHALKVYLGILRLIKESGYEKTIVTDCFTLAKFSGVSYNHRDKILESIQRLHKTFYECFNIFYRAELEGVEENSFVRFNILSYSEIIQFKNLDKLPKGNREILEPLYKNGKIKDLLILTVSDPIYENLVNPGGSLDFNQETLLSFESFTTLRLYLILEALHGYEKKSEMRYPCRFFMERIGLKLDIGSDVSDSIKYLKKAAEDLQKRGLIKEFEIDLKKPRLKSYIVFRFRDATSRLDPTIKRIKNRQKNTIIDAEINDSGKIQTLLPGCYDFKPEFWEIFNNLPAEFKTEDTKEVLQECENRGFSYDYVKSNFDYVVNYAAKHNVQNVPGLLRDALFSKDYAKKQREQAATENADSQTKQQGKNSKAAAADFSADVEKLFSVFPKKEGSKDPDRLKDAIKNALKSGKSADDVRKSIYYAVLKREKNNFPAFFEKVLNENLAASEDAETLKAQFQEFSTQREKEAAKEAEKEKLNKRLNEILKRQKELQAAYDAEIAEIEKTADSPKEAKQAAGKDSKTAICKMWSLSKERDEIRDILRSLN